MQEDTTESLKDAIRVDAGQSDTDAARRRWLRGALAISEAQKGQERLRVKASRADI